MPEDLNLYFFELSRECYWSASDRTGAGPFLSDDDPVEVLHCGNFSPVCSFTMYSAHQ
jgi:hypothetical protein